MSWSIITSSLVNSDMKLTEMISALISNYITHGTLKMLFLGSSCSVINLVDIFREISCKIHDSIWSDCLNLWNEMV